MKAIATTQREADMMEYLRLHPKKAKRLAKEAMRRSIGEIEEKYSDVIKAYAETKALLDGIIAEMVALKEIQKEKGELFDGWSVELQQLHEKGEVEWNRLGCEFDVAHGRRYDAYKQELASCKANYAELQSLLLD